MMNINDTCIGMILIKSDKPISRVANRMSGINQRI